MLKVDYTNDVFEGNRKYQVTNNDDGTISLTDVTEYTKEGDTFGGDDINSTNKEVNRLSNGVAVTLSASEWSSSAPYSQTVGVSGLKSTDVVHVYPYTPHSLQASTVKTYRKMAGMITDAESANNQMTFYCSNKKPASNFQVWLEGVSSNG